MIDTSERRAAGCMRYAVRTSRAAAVDTQIFLCFIATNGTQTNVHARTLSRFIMNGSVTLSNILAKPDTKSGTHEALST